MNYLKNQLRDYSSLFSRKEALLWLKRDFKSINQKISRYDESWFNSEKATYLDYLKFVYSIISNNYQNEYIFKNEFLNEWLISELGENNSKVFSEFRVGNSVADLAMFNGHSRIFEIKTEFDSDSRLPLQLENYKKAFNEIYLLVPESKLNLYKKQDENVGIITFDIKNDTPFRIYRDASFTLDINPSTIANILHTNEYKSIVEKYFGFLPEMTSFSQFKICSNMILDIPKSDLNTLFISEIKNRIDNNGLSSRYYKEFNQLFLALKMSRNNRNKMIDLLKTQLQN